MCFWNVNIIRLFSVFVTVKTGCWSCFVEHPSADVEGYEEPCKQTVNINNNIYSWGEKEIPFEVVRSYNEHFVVLV